MKLKYSYLFIIRSMIRKEIKNNSYRIYYCRKCLSALYLELKTGNIIKYRFENCNRWNHCYPYWGLIFLPHHIYWLYFKDESTSKPEYCKLTNTARKYMIQRLENEFELNLLVTKDMKERSEF